MAGYNCSIKYPKFKDNVGENLLSHTVDANEDLILR